VIYVGVDGGGSRTRLLALHPDGRLVLRQGPASSPEMVGRVGSAAALRATAGALLDATGEPVHAVFCLAGIDTAEESEAMARELKRTFPGWSIGIRNDTEAALWAGAPEGGPAVVVVAGTGANAAARTADGRVVALRGKGYEQGNFGGGVDLTREALHAAFRSEEGTGPATALEGAVLELTGAKNYDALAETMAKAPETLYSLVWTLPPRLYALADQGDEVAMGILDRVGRSLAGLARGAARKAGLDLATPLPVVLAGGLLAARQAVLEGAFRAALREGLPSAVPRPLAIEPVRGALLLALKATEAAGPERTALWARVLQGEAETADD
jgi:N-acetylglucosamine kinase-like BadF-type ATPase